MIPAAWIDRIFGKLAVRYGRAFLGQFDGVDLADVKADWAEVLDGYDRHPQALGWALRNLPADRAPNAGQFLALAKSAPAECFAVPGQQQIAAEPVKPNPERVAEIMARMRTPGPSDYEGPKGWAYRLRDREAAGDKLSPVQRRFWREALGHEIQDAP